MNWIFFFKMGRYTHVSAITNLVSPCLNIHCGSTQSVSTARQATHIFMTATVWSDLQLTHYHVIPITGAPLSPVSHQFESSQLLSNGTWITVSTKKKCVLFPEAWIHLSFVWTHCSPSINHGGMLSFLDTIRSFPQIGCKTLDAAFSETQLPVQSQPDRISEKGSRSLEALLLNSHAVKPTKAITTLQQQSCFNRIQTL